MGDMGRCDTMLKKVSFKIKSFLTLGGGGRCAVGNFYKPQPRRHSHGHTLFT